MIIKNAIRCNICGDEIESKHRHDFATCKCGACSVDGGHDYLRRCFKELECFLETLPLVDNNAVFNLCCRLCTAYEEKAFRHGLLYGAHLMQELFTKEDSQ